MELLKLYNMARKTLELPPVVVSVSFERQPSGTRLVFFNGQLFGAMRMVKNDNGVRVLLGTNKFGWRIQGQNIRFLLRLMGLDV